MIRHALKRVTYHGSLLFGLVLATFLLFHVATPDPARIVLGPNASETQATALRRTLGLDRPLHQQFIVFLGQAAYGDLGRSYIDGRLVAQELKERVVLSLSVVGLAFALVALYLLCVLAIPPRLAGAVSAIDFLLVSTPTMFSAVAIALVAVWVARNLSVVDRPDMIGGWETLLAPALALSLYPMAILSRILRQELAVLEHAPFILAARASGLGDWRIRAVFQFKNALPPVLGALSTMLPLFLTGAFVIEIVFSLPGLGSLVVKSVLNRDLPMLEGMVLVNGLAVVCCHLAIDVAVAGLDPRTALTDVR